MTIDHDDFINSIIASLSRIDYIKPDDIPNIELYMDQVTTFIDSHLKASKRFQDDKVLTKTMINNYAKNNLLPPPVKKKYSKEHILMLIYIYYFKNILSINDIQSLLNPLAEKYFNTTGDLNLEDIYSEVFSLETEQIDILKQDILDKFNVSQKTFEDVDASERDFLSMFSFICMLSFDVYVKKQLIEKIIDQLPTNPTKKK
jgi:DNA-binding transcriptional MerR regulator